LLKTAISKKEKAGKTIPPNESNNTWTTVLPKETSPPIKRETIGNISEGTSVTNTISTATKAACVSKTLRRETGNEKVNSPAAPDPPAIHGQEVATSVTPIARAKAGHITGSVNLNQNNHT
jgi:hypothetical protein